MANDDPRRPLRMSEDDLARLGGGEVAYLRALTLDQAQKMFPKAKGLSKGSFFFSLHAADGEPLALTETRAAACKRAWADKLSIAALH